MVIEIKTKLIMNKSTQQEKPDLLDNQTKILKVKILDGIVLVNKLQRTN